MKATPSRKSHATMEARPWSKSHGTMKGMPSMNGCETMDARPWRKSRATSLHHDLVWRHMDFVVNKATIRGCKTQQVSSRVRRD